MRKFLGILAPDRHGPDGAVAGGLVAIIIVVLVANVAVRSLSLTSFVWSVELVEQLFPWVVFLGAAAAFRMRREVVVDSIFAFLPPPARMALMAIALVVTCAVAAILTVIGVRLVFKLMPQHTMLLDISLGWRAAALPVGMALIFVVSAMRLLKFVTDPAARAAEINVSHTPDE